MITSRNTKYLLHSYILKHRLSKIYKSQSTILRKNYLFLLGSSGILNLLNPVQK